MVSINPNIFFFMLTWRLGPIYWRPPPADRGPSRPQEALAPNRQHALTHRWFAFFLLEKLFYIFPNLKDTANPTKKKHPKQNEAKNTRQHTLTHRLEFFLLSKNKQICLKPKKQFINYIYENFFFFSKTSNFEWKFVTDLSVGLKKVRNINWSIFFIFLSSLDSADPWHIDLQLVSVIINFVSAPLPSPLIKEIKVSPTPALAQLWYFSIQFQSKPSQVYITDASIKRKI